MSSEIDYYKLSKIDEINNNSYYNFITALDNRTQKTLMKSDGWILERINPLTPSGEILVNLRPSSQIFLADIISRCSHSSPYTTRISHELSNAILQEENSGYVVGCGSDKCYNIHYDLDEEDDYNDGYTEENWRTKEKTEQKRKRNLRCVSRFSNNARMKNVCKAIYDFLIFEMKFNPLNFFCNLFEHDFGGATRHMEARREGERRERDKKYEIEVLNFHAFEVFFKFETFSDCFLFLSAYNNFYSRSSQHKIPHLDIEEIYIPIRYCSENVIYQGVDIEDMNKCDSVLGKYAAFIIQPKIALKNVFKKHRAILKPQREIYPREENNNNIGNKCPKKKKPVPKLNLGPDCTQIFQFCYSNKYSISPKLRLPAVLLFLKNNFPIETLRDFSGIIFNSIRYKTFF